MAVEPGATTDGVRLSFRMSPFCRAAWVSEAARCLWEPRLKRVRTALEDLAVLAARDEAAGRVVGVRPASVDRVKDLAAEHAVPLAVLDSLPVLLPHATARGMAGRVLLRLGAAFAEGEDEIGWCKSDCASTQSRGPRWGGDDPVWEAAICTPGVERSDSGWEISIRPDRTANPLLAGIGIMAAPLWPCCFTCATARAQAAAVVALGQARGRAEEMAWLEDILSWPMSWSALHGIAEIKTPVFRYVRDTVATGKRLTVECAGAAMPEAAARGLAFPFRPKPRPAARA